MNRAQSMCMVLVVLLAGAGQGQEASKRFVRTTCLVKVPQGQEQMTSVVGSLAGTATVAGKAAKDVLGSNEGLQVDSDIVGSGVVRLSTVLPSDALAKDSAFWNAVGVNLNKAMGQVYEEQVDQIRMQLAQAEQQKAEALARLQGPSAANPRTRATQEQLDKEADLSVFKPDMPLIEAVERLRNAVKPPLRLVVLWKDLEDEDVGIESTTPIGMDGINPVRLETALKLLLKAVSNSSFDIDYVIEDGVITIATRQTLQSMGKHVPMDSEGGLSTDQLVARRQDLIGKQEVVGMDLAILQARRQAIEQQIAELNKRIDERIAGDRLLGDLQQLVEVQTEVERNTKQMVEGGRGNQQQLGEAFERVIKAKVELARQREAVAQSAGGELLAKFNAELSEISVRQAEMEAQLDVARNQLRKAETDLAQAVTSMPQKIERDLAMRSLKEAEERIFNLRQGLTNLQTPAITIIGAGDRPS